jgi:CTP synthase
MFREAFEKNWFSISGTSLDGELVEVVELRNHPFMIATQAHPEFKSRPLAPHPLFLGLVKAIIGE